MPTLLPVPSPTRVDDFPFATTCWFVTIGIVLGLTFGIADETAWLPPLSATLQAKASAAQIALAEPVAAEPLAGLQFAP